MLEREPNTSASNLCKLRPKAKLPSPSVLNALPSADAKLLRNVLGRVAEYVAHEMFGRPVAEQLMARALYEWEDNCATGDDSGVYSLGAPDPEICGLDREPYLFLRLNYCRRHVYSILDEHAGRRLGAEAVADLLHWERATMETRGEIVRENVPLVLAMGKRTRIAGVDFTDLVSEGNLALLRSVDKFDCSRGYRFSTYACRSILKSFSRVATRIARHRGHFPTEFDPALEKGDDLERRRNAAEVESVDELKSILEHNAARLSDVEQTVIHARFALEGGDNTSARRSAQTLEQVGRMIGVTKERVRQIQNKALNKLRDALDSTSLA